MIDPFKKARDDDRDAAVAAVEWACADGQITRADADLRLDRLRRSLTLGEIQAITRDLRVPESGVPSPGRSGSSLVSEATTATPSARETDRPTEGRSGTGLVFAVVLFVVLLGVGLAGVVFVGFSPEPLVARGPDAAGTADLTTPEGWEGFVAATEEQHGSTVILSAIVYPTHAVVERPVGLGGGGQRYESWAYDGEWQELAPGGPPADRTFDLARLDGRVVADTLAKVRRRVEDPTATYVLVNARGRNPRVCFSAYAADDAGAAYVDARCNGKVVLRSP